MHDGSGKEWGAGAAEREGAGDDALITVMGASSRASAASAPLPTIPCTIHLLRALDLSARPKYIHEDQAYGILTYLPTLPQHQPASTCQAAHWQRRVQNTRPGPMQPKRNRLSVGLHDGVAGVLRSSVQSIPPATLIKWRLVIVIRHILITGE
ncbi:hypothetical protein BD779DRAFT_1482706 [Infundibulicybe gibba]|nr:hypothetical protein BD779DRAFT_1482706 [Infundibulicybe gibba]